MKNGNYNAASLNPGRNILDLMSKIKPRATDGEAKDLKKRLLKEKFD